MAQLHSNFSFTGRLGNISAYKRKDSDKIILRTKGGATKDRIKQAPEFDTTRRINAEFGGRSAGSKYIMQALGSLKSLADYNIAGPLNALIKPIQAMDTESEYGRRNICFTKNPGLLDGFNLNQRNPFDSIVRNPLSSTISKEDLSARIDIPALIPGINFFVPPGKYPLYSFMAVLNIVPDLFFDTYRYQPSTNIQYLSKPIVSDWYPVLNGSPATTLETAMQIVGSIPAGARFSIMLSVGIRFGTLGVNNEVQQVKNTGAAKISAMV
ncbi:MAG: hypothetical protein Q8941_21580 [Bacteroidota bacterium]|nr:hypothetical protein [Bacteroidota bacterium]